jgi:hypothetical protein
MNAVLRPVSSSRRDCGDRWCILVLELSVLIVAKVCAMMFSNQTAGISVIREGCTPCIRMIAGVCCEEEYCALDGGRWRSYASWIV